MVKSSLGSSKLRRNYALDKPKCLGASAIEVQFGLLLCQG